MRTTSARLARVVLVAGVLVPVPLGLLATAAQASGTAPPPTQAPSPTSTSAPGTPSPSSTTAPTVAPPAWSPPPIASVLPASIPVDGLVQAAPGSSNGPLTATGFAGFSTNAADGAAEFQHWSADPLFAAYLRTWRDPSGLDTVAVELLQFPTVSEASGFAGADKATFTEVSSGQLLLATFSLPGAAGSIGFTVVLEGARRGVVQGLLFRAASYVCIVNSVSLLPDPSTSATVDTVPLGTVSSVAGQELQTIDALPTAPTTAPAPAASVGTGSTTPPPTTSRGDTTTAPTGAATRTSTSGHRARSREATSATRRARRSAFTDGSSTRSATGAAGLVLATAAIAALAVASAALGVLAVRRRARFVPWSMAWAARRRRGPPIVDPPADR